MTDSTASQGNRISLAFIVLMVGAFGICTLYALYLPVMDSEAVSIWITDDAVSLTGGSIGEAVRGQVDNLQLLVERVRMSPYMPVHTVLLDVWRLPAKDSLLLMRMLSVAFYVAGLWVTYHVCRRFTSRLSSLRAVIVSLIAFSFVSIIAPSVTPFALLMLLSTLSHLALLRWNEQPTMLNSGLYFLALSLAILTHAVALLLITIHAVYQLMRVWRLMAGVRTLDTLSDANERAGLLFWMVMAGLTSAVYWLWVTLIATAPIVDLSAQINLFPALIALLLPLLALAVAIVFGRVENTRLLPVYAGLILALIAASWLFAPQLPDWSRFADVIRSERQPTEPIVHDYTPYSALGYIDTQQHLSSGIALDLSWREYQAEELKHIAESITQGGLPVWFVTSEQGTHLQMLWTLLTTQYGYEQTFTESEPLGGFTLMRFEGQ